MLKNMRRNDPVDAVVLEGERRPGDLPDFDPGVPGPGFQPLDHLGVVIGRNVALEAVPDRRKMCHSPNTEFEYDRVVVGEFPIIFD